MFVENKKHCISEVLTFSFLLHLIFQGIPPAMTATENLATWVDITTL